MTPKANSKVKGDYSATKKKQMSLMSFFKPVSKDAYEEPSSPLQVRSSDINLNGLSIVSSCDTPTTSESNYDDMMHTEDNADASTLRSSPMTQTKQEPKSLNAANNEDETEKSPSLKKRGRSRLTSYFESDSEDEVKRTSHKKRIISSDDEDMFIPEDKSSDSESASDIDDEEVGDMSETDSDVDLSDMSEEKKPRMKKKSKPSRPISVPKKVESVSTTLGEKFEANSTYQLTKKPLSGQVISRKKSPKSSFGKDNEERYQWLVDVKDAEKRSVGDPDYDCRTLYIPQSAWTKFTAFEKQYWEIKSKMWDTVVFFKKGKFYELYENDAIIANSKFDLKIAGGGRANMKLAGIPEMSFQYWANEFIKCGYKVAKVDQKESLLAKEMRGGTTKEEKIIKRELTGILTGGTLTDLAMINDDLPIYCMSIKEEEQLDGRKKFGVAFVDATSFELNFIEINDDPECSLLDTLITQVKPKEIICEKNNLCSIATNILKYSAHNNGQIWNHLNPGKEFWDYETTLDQLINSRYFEAKDLDDFSNYPTVLLEYKNNHSLTFNAFGGLLYYLKLLKLDDSTMSLGNIKEYSIFKDNSKHLILDGVTLTNLEIFNNSYDGGEKGTLFKLLNRASTPFGKRMLKNWVLNPLLDINKINARYDAIDFLLNGGIEYRGLIENVLLSMPDLERLLARIHGKTLRFRDFLKTIEGFESIAKFGLRIKEFSLDETGALKNYLEQFPADLENLISEWEDSFNRSDAMLDIISPTRGVDEEFDSSSDKLKAIEDDLMEHLREYKKQFKSNEICYKDSGKEIFLIEMPNKVKQIPKDWQQMGSTSKVKRYWSPEVRKLVRQLLEQRETHKTVCDTLKGRMYERFNSYYSVWMKAIQCMANIDCLLALTRASESMPSPHCRPVFIDSDKGSCDFKELRHPCFVGSGEFIPNDISLGGGQARFGLLTGANAAGKSTVMRTTSLAIILCQVGCYIPAESAQLTPVDKIMTRLGANDNIMQGKSTFFVELSETKKILSNATPKSLVILDELGRGGSSSDGYSIAESVLHHISTHIQCLGFFATHYASLGLSFKNHPQIRPLRMAIVVDDSSKNITFLYKLENGTASGSFGMHVASMCGISDEIVHNATVAAKLYEQTSLIKKENLKNDIQKVCLGLQSDFCSFYNGYDLSKDILVYDETVKMNALKNIFGIIESL